MTASLLSIAACGGASKPNPIPLAQTSAGTAASDPASVQVVGHIHKPTSLPAPDLSALRAPPGFQLSKIADNLGNARMLAVGKNGAIYVTRREEADVLMLPPGANGTFGAPVRVASRAGMHGIAFAGDKVYLATPNEVFLATVRPDGTFGPLEMIIANLPDAGQHNTRTVAIGPDGMLYIAVASTCNECVETNAENATLLRATPDGTSRVIFAHGLRDMVGWGWHPETGELWGMDHGIDWLGDDKQVEELNRIEKDMKYGWPFVFGEDNETNPHIDPPGKLSKAEWKATSVPAVIGYTAHSSPMQMAFYTGTQFPAAYRNDAFIAMRGSWNRKPASGYEIVRIKFENGKGTSFEPFVTGFLNSAGESARPCGVAMLPDGSLIFTDDRNGVLYRVAYAGTEAPATAGPAAIPAGPMTDQLKRGSGVPIAMQRAETKTTGTLTVTTPAFKNGDAIPAMYSEYEQRANFPLAWSAGPAATRSYLLLMEDPDSKLPPTPFVHWVAWNIPAATTSLREGLSKNDRLEDPRNLRQGPTSAGNIGYMGPKPPAGDPPHRYHVQLFALDTELALPQGATRDMVLKAAQGHVIAKGELVGTFKRPTDPTRP